MSDFPDAAGLAPDKQFCFSLEGADSPYETYHRDHCDSYSPWYDHDNSHSLWYGNSKIMVGSSWIIT